MPPRKRKQAKQAVEDHREDVSIDISSMKVVQLKDELSKRGLDATGKKAELVRRLQDAIAGSSGSKLIKTEQEEEGEGEGEEDVDAGKSTFSKAVAALQKSTGEKKRQHKVDQHVSYAASYKACLRMYAYA